MSGRFILKIEEFMKPYDLDDATYKKICDVLLAEMEKGLNKTTNAEAVVKMLPTYVRALPDGSGRLFANVKLFRLFSNFLKKKEENILWITKRLYCFR